MTKSICKPTIKRRDMDAVLSSLVDENLSPGECSEALSKAVAQELSVSGGIAMRDFGRAIDLVAEALDLPAGSKVMVSALAPAAYYSFLKRNQLEPVVCDVDTRTATIPSEVLSAISEGEVAAVILDSPFGIVDESYESAELPVPVIEDITYDLGVETENRKAGTIGRYALIRLEEDSVITAGGGVIVLGRHSRAFGELRGVLDGCAKYSILGNLNSSLAMTQFKHRGEFADRRRSIAEVFVKALSRGKHSAPTGLAFESCSHVLFPVVLDGSMKEAVRFAKSKGVATQPAFEDSILEHENLDGTKYPNAAGLAMRCLFFPLYPLLTRDEIERVAKVLASLP